MKNFSLKILLVIVSICSFATFTSCDSDEPKPGETTRRTILIYMVATNSLNGYDNYDVEEITKALNSCDINNCRLLLYRVSTSDTEAKLVEMLRRNGKVETQLLKNYGVSNKLSLTTKRFSQVLADVKQLAPAKEYGLLLWSHSVAWAFTRSANPDATTTRSHRLEGFGDDFGETMQIDSLADAIPDGMFHFIWGDVCYMGAIEVAYELRNDTRYFIGSPTETLSYGMPYDQNVPCFFETEANLVQACKNMYNFYNNQGGEYRSVTISMVDCSKLEQVAQVCEEISIADKVIDTRDLLCYNSSSNRFFFDFLQVYNQIANDSQYSRLCDAYNDALVYKAATPKFLNTIVIDSENFSGLSTYVMGSSTARNEMAYKQLEWYKRLYR